MTGVELSNNLYYRTEGNAISWGDDIYAFDQFIGSGSTYASTYNQETGSIAGNPLLKDVVTGDYHLDIASPAIDAGTNAGFITELENQLIVGPPDIGPYEVQDRDGDSFVNAIDCNDLDNSIYQSAVEIYNDGIDQRCTGADMRNLRR